MYSLGMDLGTSTVKIVLMQNGTVEKYWLAVHHGRPLLCLRQGLSELAVGRDETLAVCVTGDNAGALLERCPVLSELGEIPAIVEGVRRLVPQAGSIIEIGSQGARFITEVQSRTRSLRPTSIAQAAPVPFLRIRCPVWAASWRIILRWLSRRRAFCGFPDAAQCLPKRISFTASRKVFPRRISCWDCAMQ